jgi:formylglycine-generating enzyme
MNVRNSSCALLLVTLFLGSIQAADPPKPDVTANSIGLKLALIPAGEFLMGSHESLDDIEDKFKGLNYKAKLEQKILDADEWPQHKVRITKPFRLGVYEVTVGQFRQFCKEASFKSQAESDGTGGYGINSRTGKFEGRKPEYNWQQTGYELTAEHPVVNVTWNDANAFCAWLSKKEGKKYRLPTEAEWEYACRAGTKTRYVSGDEPESVAKVGNIADASGVAQGLKEFPDYKQFALKANDGHFTTAPVGSFAANAFGLHDMHGNVWEWCQDYYDENYYSKSPVDDPKGPADGSIYVRRGGAFHTFPLYVRSSFRNWNSPQTRYLNLGFRVARDE